MTCHSLPLLNLSDISYRLNPRNDVIHAPKHLLEVLVGPIIWLRAKRFKEVFNGFLQDTWAKVDFKRILNNEKKVVINIIHVQEGLVDGTKTITQGLGEED